MASAPDDHAALIADLTRRDLLARAGAAGLGAVMVAALPATRAAGAALPVIDPGVADATLQAFADTMIPGRRVAHTESGRSIDPRAIAGVDRLPGAVETDALALYHHPEVGFDALQAEFLADLEAGALSHGGDFLSLAWRERVATCVTGLSFSNSARLLWEAAAAVPFTAFCAAALVPEQTARKAAGYRVMGLPGRAPNGYTDFSYRRRLSRERTRHGSLR
ncbi:MAG: hypothetical protein QOK31_651 [Solirubrobacteraceae bacterium]|nr:hypothetical protein [Solirubrobacteraceae bacterium]